MWRLLMSLTFLAAAQAALAAEPATQPASAPSQEALAAPMVERLRSATPQDRPAAVAAIGAAATAMGEALLSRADDKDVEVHSRVSGALEQMRTQTTLARCLATMSKPMRQKMLALRASKPEIVDRALSKDRTAQLAALEQIPEIENGQVMAEPLVILLAASPYADVQQAAAQVAKGAAMASDEMVDALLHMFLTPYHPIVTNWLDAEERANMPNPVLASLNAITALKCPRAAPTLLALMQRNNFYMMDYELVVPDALVACGELRAIPTLIARLDDKKVLYADQKTTTSIMSSDVALYVLVKLTGGNVDDYGFVALAENQGVPAVAFFSPDARKEALAKFRAWWDANKDKAPYKDLKPLPLPTLPAGQ